MLRSEPGVKFLAAIIIIIIICSILLVEDRKGAPDREQHKQIFEKDEKTGQGRGPWVCSTALRSPLYLVLSVPRA